MDTASPVTASLALLKAWYDSKGGSFLGLFVPFLCECLRRSGDQVVSVVNIAEQMKQSFGLKVPQNVLSNVARVACKQGYLKQERGAYYPVAAKLATLGFQEVQDEVLRKYEHVVEELRRHAATMGAVWTTEQADHALSSFLRQVSTAEELRGIARSEGTVPPNEPLGAAYYVATFLQNASETHAASFSFYKTVLEGHMLANAMYLRDCKPSQRSFSGTSIYFDTRFLLFALGELNGPERQAPCLELISMLKNFRATLCCFEHNLVEMRQILESIAHVLERQGAHAVYGPAADYIIEQHVTPSDVWCLHASLPDRLAKLGIIVRGKPPYTPYENVIGEADLREILPRYVKYHEERAERQINADVDSISAIWRIRRAQKRREYEDCDALFVTSNVDLVKAEREYSTKHLDVGVPLTATDRFLTTIVWLKIPQAAPQLSAKRIIADCYAAVRPTPKLWAAYNDHVNKLEDRGGATADELFMLRHSLEAREALMEKTSGELDVLTEATPTQILARIKESIREQEQLTLAARIAEQDDRIKELSDKLVKAQVEQFESRQRVSDTARRLATIARWGAAAVLLFTVLLLTIEAQKLVIHTPLPWLPTYIPGTILGTLSALSLVLDWKPTARLVSWVERKVIVFIETWFGLANKRS